MPKGGTFNGTAQAQDSARAAAIAADFNRRFSNAARIGVDAPYGEQARAKRGRAMTQAETDRFNARFPGASRIGQV
ncbi:MAG TPA: hypothetical protein VGF53_09870 [Pseudolabrys sp.]